MAAEQGTDEKNELAKAYPSRQSVGNWEMRLEATRLAMGCQDRKKPSRKKLLRDATEIYEFLVGEDGQN